MLPIAMAWSFFGGATKSQGKWAILGVFYSTDNALYSTAFGIHTKADELIKMSLGLMTRVGPRYRVLDGRPSPKGEGAVFEGKRSKPL